VHTPGHAPGHLVLSGGGWIVAGDMVAGVGTIVLDPSEGDLQDYLDSLERLRTLGADRLLPAHGPVMPHADAVLSFYVAHRHQRTDQVRGALVRLGASRPDELAPAVYPELDPRMLPVAAMQILTHLRWLGAHGLAREVGERRWAA
jgi:glyoxylase-like metal-dependent hydrolase (beta-lactamase superfamily II)